jgi:hypothetical protein
MGYYRYHSWSHPRAPSSPLLELLLFAIASKVPNANVDYNYKLPKILVSLIDASLQVYKIMFQLGLYIIYSYVTHMVY